MKELRIKLGSIEDVKEFVELANKYPFDCSLVSGRYAVNAKSIMGIFSLDLSKAFRMVTPGGAGDEEFFAKAAKFSA